MAIRRDGDLHWEFSILIFREMICGNEFDHIYVGQSDGEPVTNGHEVQMW